MDRMQSLSIVFKNGFYLYFMWWGHPHDIENTFDRIALIALEFN